MATYEQTIPEVHAALLKLQEQVEAGTYSQDLVDAYLASARQRPDWVEL
jgi:hypothetical protein